MGDQLQPPLQSPFPSPHATFLVLAWQALVRDLWSTPVVRDSLSHHLCALINFCSQALDCASALDRVCRFQPLYLLMAARQTSIITTTAPPANTRHECGDRVSRSSCCVSHSCRTAPIHNHIVARTGRNDRTSQSARGNECKLAHTARNRLPFQNHRAKITRFLFVPQRTTLNCPSRNACWCHK